MTTPWLFHPEIPDVDGVAVLDVREARHATVSRRLRGGATVVLFDGCGGLAEAQLLERGSGGRSAEAKIVSREQRDRESGGVHVVAALPKGDRQSVMLGMATQLGMASFTPLECERSVARCSAAFADRARRIFVEACKQSRRTWLPEVLAATTPADAAADHCARGRDVWLAHPGGEAIGGLSGSKERCLVVGPEGGFTDEEIEAMQSAGARIVSLGHSILRTETAVVAMLATATLAHSG